MNFFSLVLASLFVCFSAQCEMPTIVQTMYTLSESFNEDQVHTAINVALQDIGIDPSSVEFQFASHYKSLADENSINISGRQKGDYFVLWMVDVPIMLFFNKKTFGSTLNVDKDFLTEVVKSVTQQTPFKYKDISLNRPIRFCAGAVMGLSRRAVSYYTKFPYASLKRLGEYSEIFSDHLNHIQNRIEKDEIDLMTIPLPLQNIQFKQNATNLIGIAKVEGKDPTNPQYPFVSPVSMGSFNKPDLERKQKIVSALNAANVKVALEKIGYRFVEGDLESIFQQRQKDFPDLFSPAKSYSQSTALPTLQPSSRAR